MSQTVSKHIELRDIKKEEYPVFLELIKKTYSVAYNYLWEDNGEWVLQTRYGLENVAAELQALDSNYYFVLYDTQIIGMMRLLWNSKMEDTYKGSSMMLQRIYLDSDHQGEGIGKKLLDWVENKARENNYNMVWLEAMDSQERALQFYISNGYTKGSHCKLPYNLMKPEYKGFYKMFKVL